MPQKTKQDGAPKKKDSVPAKKKDYRGKSDAAERPYYVVCVGASAGGLNATIELISQFPATINAAIFVVLHMARSALGEILEARIKKNCALKCSVAVNRQRIEAGNIYIAAVDTHLLVRKDEIVVGHGPPENRFRPSIDVLFRSAAAHYGPRSIGVVLTGFLNDGTIGMEAIRQSGGHCIVQDPNEAEYPDMPLSVIENVAVDYAVSLKKMGRIISDIVKHAALSEKKSPDNIIAESNLSEKAATGIEKINQIGKKTDFGCPDCGGNLWTIQNGRLKHYRCHIGHSYSEADLAVKQIDNIQSTLWVALRMMEERKALLSKLAGDQDTRGLETLSISYRQGAARLNIHIKKLKELLFYNPQ